jgi:hypothetical protein
MLGKLLTPPVLQFFSVTERKKERREREKGVRG